MTRAESEILVAAIDRGSAKVLLMRAIGEISKKIKSGVKARIFTPVNRSNTEQFKEVKSEVRHLPVRVRPVYASSTRKKSDHS